MVQVGSRLRDSFEHRETRALDAEAKILATPPDQSVHEPVPLLLRALETSQRGLTSREAARRLITFGPNELRRRVGRTWPRELARQFTHPLALLLWAPRPFRHWRWGASRPSLD